MFFCCYKKKNSVETQTLTEKDFLDMLKLTTKGTVKQYSLEGQILYAKVVSVYDGDTFTVNVYQPKENDIYQYTVRCLGYDAPEMKPPIKTENRDDIIGLAYIARNTLIEWLTGIDRHHFNGMKKNEVERELEKLEKLIKIQCQGWDKYGRLLVSIPFTDEMKWISNPRPTTISEAMIMKGLGKAYDGGTKEKW